MLYSSPVFSQASGSLAGITFLHGRSGLMCRSRSTPTNPSSLRQREIRYAVSRLSPYWGSILTGTQRDGWRLYADNVAMTNRLGASIFLSGFNHFMRSNIPRIQAGIAIVEDAPIIYDLGTWTLPDFVKAWTFLDLIQVNVTPADHWATNEGGYILLYSSRPTDAAAVYNVGHFRYYHRNLDLPRPINIIQTGGPEWPLLVGTRIWVYARIIQTDGRLSGPIDLGSNIVTFL